MIQTYKTVVLATSLVALTGCASWDKSPICTDKHGWLAWSDVRCNADNAPQAEDNAARLAALEKERQRLADELAAAQKQNGALSSHVSELEGQLSQSKGSLIKAEKDLLKALQPEISKGTVSVNQSDDALTINLVSSLLFDSGQDQLKVGGNDALKRVGRVLKDFPDKQVHVAGYTDNVAIAGVLQKKYPSNKELSTARAYSAARALRDGGVDNNLSAAGHGDSNPIASNNTEAGRAKNRRVEVIVK
ncbi:MAG: OmpA family protein [Nitrospiraceae bacterium]